MVVVLQCIRLSIFRLSVSRTSPGPQVIYISMLPYYDAELYVLWWPFGIIFFYSFFNTVMMLVIDYNDIIIDYIIVIIARILSRTKNASLTSFSHRPASF